ncbi:MAG: hypothetical protein IJ869_08060 [Clostridiales bacterium]|nr:hypothetical protein [Clostridiales bacterium]
MIEKNIKVVRWPASELPPVDVKEVWRYSGCREIPENGPMSELMDAVIRECADVPLGQVCYSRTPHLPFETDSKGLAKVISGSSEVIVFAATIGLGFDRLIGKYKRVSPSKALLIQGLGAERIEALCDTFCATFEGRTMRYSPGYGDLPITCQKDIFSLLKCEEKIGITLSGSLMMTPSKSVTAIFGIREDGTGSDGHDCSLCGLRGCEFRREHEDT